MSSGNVHSAEGFLQFGLVPGLVQLGSDLVPNLEMCILHRPFHNLGLVPGLVQLGSDLVPCWKMWIPQRPGSKISLVLTWSQIWTRGDFGETHHCTKGEVATNIACASNPKGAF